MPLTPWPRVLFQPTRTLPLVHRAGGIEEAKQGVRGGVNLAEELSLRGGGLRGRCWAAEASLSLLGHRVRAARYPCSRAFVHAVIWKKIGPARVRISIFLGPGAAGIVHIY